MNAEPDAGTPPADDSRPPEPPPIPDLGGARVEDVEPPLRTPIRESAVTLLLPIAAPRPLEPLLTRWRPLLDKLPAGSHLLLVDDAESWPETQESTAPADNEPRIVRHVSPLGLGGALGTGLLFVDTPLVFAAVDDETFDPLECLKLWDEIDHIDIACACRSIGPTPFFVAAIDRAKAILARVLMGYDPDPRVGWTGSGDWLPRLVTSRGFGVPVADPFAGMILARTEAIRGLPIQSRGSFAWTELIAKSNHLEGLLTDVPVAATKPVARDPDFFADAGRLFLAIADFGPPRRSIPNEPEA